MWHQRVASVLLIEFQSKNTQKPIIRRKEKKALLWNPLRCCGKKKWQKGSWRLQLGDGRDGGLELASWDRPTVSSEGRGESW